VAVVGGLTFASISATSGQLRSAGYYDYYDVPVAHSCGVTSGRVVYCWGTNASGQLGGPISTDDSPQPVKVAGQK
jgi:alpha-tubulin suppressor-like RCC1 family protein